LLQQPPRERNYASQIWERLKDDPSKTLTLALKKAARVARGERQEAANWEHINSRIEAISAAKNDSLTVLQVGANDGIHNDPLREHLVKHPKWLAVLVEPNPHAAAALSDLYKGRPNVLTVEAAITDHDGTATLYAAPFIADGSKHPLQGKDSLDQRIAEHFTVQVRNGPTIMQPVGVRAMTVDTLFRETLLTDGVDGIFIDTEGHDKVILDQIDLESDNRPSFVMFEFIHLARADLEAVTDRFENAGYSMVQTERDIFAELS